jgi:hypothetical protein
LSSGRELLWSMGHFHMSVSEKKCGKLPKM